MVLKTRCVQQVVGQNQHHLLLQLIAYTIRVSLIPLFDRTERWAYGVIGMLLRIREPRVLGVVPSLLSAAPGLALLSPAPDCLAGVSRTNFLNCELFMVVLEGDVLEGVGDFI